MSNKLADDFSSIARRMREIEWEKRLVEVEPSVPCPPASAQAPYMPAPAPICHICNGAGSVITKTHGMIKCPHCKGHGVIL